MNRNDLYAAFGEIDDDVLERSEAATKPRRRPAWAKWGAMAACLCLVAAIAVPMLQPKAGNAPEDQDQLVSPLDVIEFNGAYYEVIDTDAVSTLDKFNLPHDITADMVGASLGAGTRHGGIKSEETLYQHVPYAGISTVEPQLGQVRTQRAVYVVEKDGSYSFALFCNFIGFDSNTHTEASEMLAVYGVDEASDIASITIGKEKITDKDRIERLFDALLDATAMGNDDFQNAVFGGISEEAQQPLHTELADTAIEISAMTTDGIAINNIRYYPTISYVYWAVNYYLIDEPLS